MERNPRDGEGLLYMLSKTSQWIIYSTNEGKSLQKFQSLIKYK